MLSCAFCWQRLWLRTAKPKTTQMLTKHPLIIRPTSTKMAQITKLLWFVFVLIYPIMITRLVLASAKTPTTSLLGRLVYVQRATNGMELPAYHAHIPASPVPIPTFVVIVSMGTFSRMTEHAHRLQQIFLDCFKMLMETLTNAV